jgi:hypothetical protein
VRQSAATRGSNGSAVVNGADSTPPTRSTSGTVT